MSDMPAWDVLAALPAWSLTELPRTAPRGEPAKASADKAAAAAARDDRMLTLAAACGEGAPVAFGWVRERAQGPVRIIAAGNGMRAEDAGAQAGSDGRVKLGYPLSGARGITLRPGGLAEAFTALPWWVPVAVTPDALLAGDEKNPAPSVKPYGTGVLRSWGGPFGWLVLAVPVDEGRREELLGKASLEQLTAERHDAPRAQLAARRWKARHDELRGAAIHGLWDIWLLAGAADKRDLMRVAGLVSASLHPRGMPFGLRRLEERQGRLPEVLGPLAARPAPAPAADGAGFGGLVPQFPDPEPQFPCAASSELLAALAVPPSKEVPGVRFTLEPDFDVTPETADGTGLGEIPLGTILDPGRLAVGNLAVGRGSLNRHTFVCGATGAGKSQTVRHLLESATGAGIPWLVIEPAKAEYRLMAARLPDAEVVTIRPGDLGAVPAGINPLEPATGPDGERFPLQAHADLVRALFLAAFQADEPFPQVLAAALQRCYEEAGFDLVTGKALVGDALYPTLGDLQAAAITVVDRIGYSQEISDNVRGFVSVRIGSLRGGTTGRFLEGGFPLDYDRLLSGNVVLEIEDCGDDLDKAFLTGAVVVRLTEHLRMRSRAEAAAGGASAPGLRHLTVVEEAHRLLRQPAPGEGGGPAAHAVEMFAGLLAEIRAYGEGLVIAEQIPSKLIPDAIKNTAVKIVHRLPAADDRDAVGATMNLTEDQSRYLVTLRPGEAAVFMDGMDYPVLAKMPDGTGRESGAKIRPAPVRGLTGMRSPGCPASCGDGPCSLGRVAAAQRAGEEDWRLGLWAELGVLAHVTGWPVPEPVPELAAALKAVDPRVLECSLGHAVEAAVRSRVPALVPRVPPAALTAHVAAVLRRLLAGGERCPREEPEWLAPACEWEGVLDALTSAGDLPHRHPRSDDWEQAHGRAIPGQTCAEQRVHVAGWHEQAWNKDTRRRGQTVFGTGTPSVIETVLGGRGADPYWAQRAGAAVEQAFTRSGWAAQYLGLGTGGDAG